MLAKMQRVFELATQRSVIDGGSRLKCTIYIKSFGKMDSQTKWILKVTIGHIPFIRAGAIPDEIEEGPSNSQLTTFFS